MKAECSGVGAAWGRRALAWGRGGGGVKAECSGVEGEQVGHYRLASPAEGKSIRTFAEQPGAAVGVVLWALYVRFSELVTRALPPPRSSRRPPIPRGESPIAMVPRQWRFPSMLLDFNEPGYTARFRARICETDSVQQVLP